MTRSSRQRGEMVCTVCQTRTSPLWRRGDKGEVLCNACGLYHKHHKKPRPISLANSSARSSRRTSHQNNENKIQNQRFQNIYPNVMNSSIRPHFPFTTAIAPALTTVNATGSTLKSGNNMSPNLQPNMYNTTSSMNNMNMYTTSSHSMSTLSPTFKMTSVASSSMPIPIKKPMSSSSVASPPLSHSLSPPLNTPPLLKMNNNNNQNNNNNRKLPMPPAPLAQKNNSEHYYNYNLLPSMVKDEDGNVKPMEMDSRDDSMMMSDEDNRYNQRPSKASIASIMNSMDTPINNYQNHKYDNYNALPTPLSSSPSNINSSNSNSSMMNSNNYDHQDIEAAHLLISLRNCEKVC
ncbi:hypothetical protein BCR32DRAFT_325342 [Anaeromyces robustus]|uniref:GATA-type domain-containing protein n=1 Tax=Anaeromyces robustus TaxID=1754192 RepID=A0A1Y1XJY8_9FUNG|nr:hypothetical protein BCR32DRAFT_325342 [Anaeromyces robustus]|eukprot:ORX85664.1 hypothetical protein BCR32DRAFT_325342 [Anaeromyces robustus]